MGQRDLAKLQLVRDGLAGGSTPITRGMHLRNPVVNQLNGQRLKQVADHEKS